MQVTELNHIFNFPPSPLTILNQMKSTSLYLKHPGETCFMFSVRVYVFLLFPTTHCTNFTYYAECDMIRLNKNYTNRNCYLCVTQLVSVWWKFHELLDPDTYTGYYVKWISVLYFPECREKRNKQYHQLLVTCNFGLLHDNC